MDANLPAPVVALIARTVAVAPGAAVALCAADAATALELAQRAGTVTVYDSSHGALQALARRRAPKITLSYEVFPAAEAAFDLALVPVATGREFVRAQLWSALNALRPQGTLYIVGANDAGVKSAVADAVALCGAAHTHGHKQGYRIASAVKSAVRAAYPAAWLPLPTEPQVLTFETPAGTITVVSQPGIFSWRALDDGTRLLLEAFDLTALGAGQRVLDLGCGNGVLGLLAARYARQVTLVDDNLLAVRCAQAGAERQRTANVRALPSDVYTALGGQRFDLILANPPFHAGSDVDTAVARRMISAAPQFLAPGGRLVVVANAFLPYQALFEQHFRSVAVLANNKRYMVLVGQ